MAQQNKENLFNQSVKTKNAKPTVDVGFINKESGTTMTIKESGTATMNSGIYAQYKCDKDSGVTTETAMQSISNTVQRELTLCDLIVNRHKFNTQLIEFTNLVSNMETVMGNLTFNSTILVKAWEPTLEQFVLIRRPARFSAFGNLLDAYTIDDRLAIKDDYEENLIEYKKNLNDLTPPVPESTTEENTTTEDSITTEDNTTTEDNPQGEVTTNTTTTVDGNTTTTTTTSTEKYSDSKTENIDGGTKTTNTTVDKSSTITHSITTNKK